MFRTLIYPSSGTCYYSVELPRCNMDTTPTQPHRIFNTHRTNNNTTNVVIQQSSNKLLMMDILMSETCWAYKKWNKIVSDIKLVFYSSTFKIITLEEQKLSPEDDFVTSLFLKPHRRHIVQAFRIALFTIPLLKHTNNSDVFFHVVWSVEITGPTDRHTSALFFPFSVFRITSTFPSTLKTFLLFVTVAMLSRSHSHVNCRCRIVMGNFTHKMNFHYYCHFSGTAFVWLPDSVEGLAFSRTRRR